MPSSLQDHVLSLFERAKWSRRSSNPDEKSNEYSRKSFSDSLSSATPLQSTKQSPGIVSSFRCCFAPVTNDSTTFAFQDVSVNSWDDGKTDKPLSLAAGHAPADNAITFTVSDLMKATDNFSPSLQIGQGGFGTVYKGRLKDGRIVAVKRAKKTASDMQLSAEFRSELSTLSNVEHLNLVKFIGYAAEGSERILVVEYVPNGNLRQHLDGQFGTVLDLATRLDIAIDVAHAVTYLHLYADRPIIHRDIKSTNILLTSSYRAKVADFGFSRLGPWELDSTHVSTQVKGTAGYLDPEYLRTYQLTQKSDVYSFGILLVEMLTGRHPIEQKRERSERITARWAFDMFHDGKALQTLDPKLEKSPSASLMVEKVLELAFQCASPTKQQRPSMKKTAEVLWNIRKDYKTIFASYSPPSSSSSQKPLLQLLQNSDFHKYSLQP